MTKERLKKIMGENIRNERVSRSMSIDELAELLELTSGFVGLIERGRRGATAYTLFKLSDIFGMPIDDMFVNTDGYAARVSEDKSSPVKAKRAKINSILYDLNESELDFIIAIIKELKNMQLTISGKKRVARDDQGDEEDEEE